MLTHLKHGDSEERFRCFWEGRLRLLHALPPYLYTRRNLGLLGSLPNRYLSVKDQDATGPHISWTEPCRKIPSRTVLAGEQWVDLNLQRQLPIYKTLTSAMLFSWGKPKTCIGINFVPQNSQVQFLQWQQILQRNDCALLPPAPLPAWNEPVLQGVSTDRVLGAQKKHGYSMRTHGTQSTAW